MELSPPTPKQRACIQLAQEGRVNVWEGSVRSGKTINSLVAWANFVGTAPKGPLLMAGRTTDTLKRNVMEPLIDLLGSKYVRASYGGGWAQIMGRKVHLVGADNQAAESRIRGLTLAGAYVDELTIIGAGHGQEWFEMLLTRMSVQGAKVFATTNPGHPNHWLLKNYLQKAAVTVTKDNIIEHNTQAPPGLQVYRYRYTLADNPALPQEYVESLKASMSGVFARRFIEGEWVAAEGSVFPNLDTTKPLTIAPQHLHNLVVGIDVGTTNPTHAVLLGTVTDPSDSTDKLAVASEYRSSDNTLTYAQQVARINTWLSGLHLPHPPTIVVDPSARAFRNEWRRATGTWPWSADNTVLTGISDLGTLLTRDLLLVDQAVTPILAGELAGYRWDTRASERGEDKPVKEDDHSVDALRYAVQALKKQWKPWATTKPPEEIMFRPAWMDN